MINLLVSLPAVVLSTPWKAQYLVSHKEKVYFWQCKTCGNKGNLVMSGCFVCGRVRVEDLENARAYIQQRINNL